MRRALVTVMVSLVLLPSAAYAQRITAAIRGTVRDATQAVVPGATVVLLGRAIRPHPDHHHQRRGDLRRSRTCPWARHYRVEVYLAGFKSEARSKIMLNVADVREVNFEIATGDITEVVNVESAAVAVKTVGADVSGLVTGEQARELPLNGRNFMQLTLLQPGVTAHRRPEHRRTRGWRAAPTSRSAAASTTSNVWMVDGANNNDVGSNRTILVYPSVDAIEEFKIQRNNYGAEFGQAGGAQVNLVTRGGTNDFHGSAYYYARRDRLNSTDYFLEQADQEKAPLKWDDFGGTFGGPIIKDKLHFFVSLGMEQGQAQRRPRRRSCPPRPSAAGDFSGAASPAARRRRPSIPSPASRSRAT